MENIPETERIAKSLEPILILNKNMFLDKDIGYFYRIAEFFTDISSEKYNVKLYSCACYILFKMNIEDLINFKFERDKFYEYAEHIMPLFKGKTDNTQIINALFRYCCFIMLNKNLDMNNIIIV